MGGSRYALADRYTAERGRFFLTGIQALARLPLDQLRADRRAGRATAAFVSGYPGSPLGGYDRAVLAAAKLAPELRVVCRPAVNEELAATAVMGSQLAATRPDARYAGVLGIWYGKSPGVDRACDALRHATFAGASPSGGALALVGDDPTAKSSTLPSSSASLLANLYMPMFYPGDPAEALDLGRHAIALSRASGLWTALKIVADVADGTATVDLDPDRVQPILPLHEGQPYARQPEGRLLSPLSLALEREMHEVRLPLVLRYAYDNKLNRAVVDPESAWIGIVASGITYREVREAFARLGLRSDAELAACGIRVLKMQLPLPFDPRPIREFARGLEEVFVIEEKAPNIEHLIKNALYSLPDRPRVVGRQDEHEQPLTRGWGGLDADAIVPALRARLEPRVGDRLAPLLASSKAPAVPLAVQRTPFYCSGCPHNRSTEVPKGALVGAGIGCHSMVMLMDPARVGEIAGVTCMGSEGAQWIGMADFVETPHLIQNLGDGTFFHSGQLAIQAAVAANVNITYKLLHNGTIAMTGGQDPQGQIGVPEIARTLLAHGVRQVLITADHPERYEGVALPAGVEVWERARLIEAQELLAKVSGVSVLIHDQMCAAESRRLRKRGKLPTPRTRVAINHRICEGCGDCGEVSGCLSVQPVETPFGRKTAIDQTTCNLDYSCLEGDCPSFVTITAREPGRIAKALARIASAGAARSAASPKGGRGIAGPSLALPEPVASVPSDEFALRITGVGGTGVVTVAQVIGTAALFDGFEVRGLDQVGLSQKAGPVVSDLRLSKVGPAETNRLGAEQADLLLVFDTLVGASEKGLLTSSTAHTAVVGSTSTTPTGAMITHPNLALPPVEELVSRIGAATRRDAQHWADSEAITHALFGDSQTANFFVIGMALQAGTLPVHASSIERAIELNGVAVAANIAAFRWGRAQVARPEVVAAAVAEATRAPAPGLRVGAAPPLDPALAARATSAAPGDPALADELLRYARELVAFENTRLAADYLDAVARVAAAEAQAKPGSTRLARAVAAHLFKLTAYKDEYEVARLMLDAEGLRPALEVAAETGGRGAWQLHPPLLRALGLKHKLAIPFWCAPAIRALAKLKFLRGSALDPFGWPEIRRIERALPGEYLAALDSILPALDASNLDQALRIAALPDSVRGYEDVKLPRAREFQLALRRELASFDAAIRASRSPTTRVWQPSVKP
jgi:indolepyruvate ferredoxin oxidoreductase